jgi:hypothetical protein
MKELPEQIWLTENPNPEDFEYTAWQFKPPRGESVEYIRKDLSVRMDCGILDEICSICDEECIANAGSKKTS